MNYQKHYNLLMNRAKHRKLEGYCESHHILPICMGGEGTEEVILTPEEHYVAHQLLVKIYPNNFELVYAANMMTVSGIGQVRSNKKYGWLKRKFSENISKQFKGKHFSPSTEFKKGMKPTATSWKKGHIPWAKGKTGIFSQESLKIMSEKRKGNKYALGAIRSEETRQKISIANTGKNIGNKNGMASEENRKKVAASKFGRKWYHNPITKQAICVLPENKPEEFIPGKKLAS
jgi:hypothetical protein